MSSYVVLARKWRPSQFSDIVGQAHIVRTMMNAIKSGRVHQAYLMTGSRGIGKTSIARIFAKAMRCENANSIEKNGQSWLRSCDQCSSCKEIASGNSVDVLEIDGASNNGVDAIREIRENAKYLPSSGSKKIYIVDEVHMLTTAAFNALLKTLEEPPPHVLFIFATTEPHKIPATILSRCQRFDLRRVTLAQIQMRLIEVTSAENVQAEAGALALIARAAEGSMRDAMSLLDQVIAFSGNTIPTQSAREAIGLIEGQTTLGILRGVLSRKPLEALASVDQAYQAGHDLKVLTRALIEFLYGTILAKLGATGSSSLELSEDEWKEIQALAPLRELEELELIFQVLSQGVEWIAKSPQPKIVLDVLLIKCATAEALVTFDGSGGGTSGPVARDPAPSTGPRRMAPQSPSPPSLEDRARSTASALPTNANSTPVPELVPEMDRLESTPPSTEGWVAVPSPKGPPPMGFAQRLAQAAAASTAAGLSPGASTPTRITAPLPIRAAAPVPHPSPAIPAGPRNWEGFIDYIKQTRPLLASFLEHGSCQALPNPADPAADLLIIAFRPEDGSFRDNLSKKVYSDQVNAMGKDYFQRSMRVQAEISATMSGESLALARERQRTAREVAAREAAQNHPIIAEARALFGGELGPIELIEPREEAAQ